MVIARVTQANDRLCVVLGLTPENVKRLQAGQSIYLTPETHPGIPDGFEIALVLGASEVAMRATLEAAARDESLGLTVTFADRRDAARDRRIEQEEGA